MFDIYFNISRKIYRIALSAHHYSIAMPNMIFLLSENTRNYYFLILCRHFEDIEVYIFIAFDTFKKKNDLILILNMIINIKQILLDIYKSVYNKVNIFYIIFRIPQKFQMQITGSFAYAFILLIIHQLIRQTQSVDTYSSYYTGSATAMDIHYSSNSVVFANANKQILLYSTTPGAVQLTINTGHKAKIGTLAISPDKSKVLSGSYGYTTQVHDLTNGNLLCTFDELRGNIISSKIAADNDFYAFGSNEGYLYYGHITNCSKNIYNRTDYVLKSLDIIQSRNQIWLADGTAGFFVFNIISKTIVAYTLPTDNSNSIYDLSALSVVGLCTAQAFYLINYTGVVKFTLTYPTLYTLKCRMASDWGNATGIYYLTATTERTSYTYNSNRIYTLWNIWKVDVTNLKALLYLEQRNTANRYSATGASINDAAAYLVNSRQIYVTSITDGYNPFNNAFYDTMPISSGANSCSSNRFFSASMAVPCQKCNWNDAIRPFCYTCNTGGYQCNGCDVYTYISSSSCLPCSANCYFCSSASTCLSCFGGYTLIGSSCLLSNLSGCIDSFWNSSSEGGVSQCYNCARGYFGQNNLICKECHMIYPNCSLCDDTTCFECDPNFVLLDTTGPNICQSCSYFIEGCAACLNQTYCDTCFEWYPYFHYPNSTSRICKRICYHQCYDCSHMQYQTCTGCDANRTLINNTCYCLPEFPIYDTKNLICQECRDYINYCVNCTTQYFCVQCDLDYFFQDLNSTHQYCKTCNYTCATCDTYWYKCATCDSTQHRILDSTTHKCVCQSNNYFESGNQTACALCSDAINDCQVCFNQTYCITCISGYFVNTVSAGNKNCAACTAPCTQCFGNATNCSDCYAGRQLNTTTRTCDCLVSYYPTGTTTCSPCYPILGSCSKCTNDSVCLQCWPNNYFYIDATDGKKKCGLCKRTCLTCATYSNVCGTCDSLANRIMNPATQQCDCKVGYVQTDGRCLNCSAQFQYCTSCNGIVCFSCEPGYSLAFGGLKCVDCASTYPGCVNCLNGVCAACNQTDGYELAYSKCICKPGRYFKALKCPPYVMGPTIQRLFPVHASYSQDMDTDQITIKIYFECQKIKIPYGIGNSVYLSVNHELITTYSVVQSNTTFLFKFTPDKDLARAYIKIQFLNNTIFDKDQYGPKKLIWEFNKNIFVKSSYQLSSSFATFYIGYIISAVRWVCTIFILLGCADYVLLLVFTVHFLPAFVLLNLSPPLPLYNALLALARINSQSLFTFADINVNYENYDNYLNRIDTFGITGGLVNKKIMDLVFLGCLLAFYGILCPFLMRIVPEGTMKRFWHHKFQLKKYSTLANITLCFLPSFQFCSILDFRMQILNPTSYITISISLILLAFSCVFIFVHSITLQQTQFNDEYKNQDCYFASSILQPKSITYVLSLLMISTCSIPLLGFFEGIISTSIIMLIILWHIVHYRFWDNFPNKLLYFLKLFYALFLLFFSLSFLIFSISEKYEPMQIASITLVGLICLVFILVIFAMACLQTIILLATTVYKGCKQSTSLVDNIQNQKQRNLHPQNDNSSHEASSVYNMRIKLAAERAKQQQIFNVKLTNKEEHMRKFHQQHLSTIGDKMYIQTMNQDSFNASTISISKKRK